MTSRGPSLSPWTPPGAGARSSNPRSGIREAVRTGSGRGAPVQRALRTWGTGPAMKAGSSGSHFTLMWLGFSPSRLAQQLGSVELFDIGTLRETCATVGGGTMPLRWHAVAYDDGGGTFRWGREGAERSPGEIPPELALRPNRITAGSRSRSPRRGGWTVRTAM